MEPKSIPTNDELVRLADIARVPQENCEKFSIGIVEFVLPHIWDFAKPPTKPRSKALSRAISAMHAARQAVVDLEYIEGSTFGPSDEEWLENGQPDSFINFGSIGKGEHRPWKSASDTSMSAKQKATLARSEYLEHLAWVIEEFLVYAGENLDYRRLQPQEIRRGPRAGRNRNRPLEDLVIDLIYCAETYGGRLTLEKNNGRGTLIDALRVIAPHVPKGMVPPALSGSTLQRIKTEYAKRAERGS